MDIPGGIEVFLVYGVFLLVILALAGRYVLGWVREGYEGEVTDDPEAGSSE